MHVLNECLYQQFIWINESKQKNIRNFINFFNFFFLTFEYYERENAVSNLKFDVNKKIDKNIQYNKKYIFSMFVNF